MSIESHALFRTEPGQVHEVLRRYLLVDGFDFVYDPEASHGAFLVDARNGNEHLDLFSFFASQPIGHNHRGLADPVFRERLLQAALTKPTSSDVYTQAMADFVQAFARTLPPAFKHLFFIEGGALAVENALKTAFDWKVRKNLAAGRGDGLGTQVIHFRGAFHGRSGYTLSLTNSHDLNKIRYFPKFPWPRVSTPGRSFPETPERLRATIAAEQASLAEIRDAVARNRHDVAALIVETIQGEGGDVHFRPEFLRALRALCDEEEILLVFDEVQAGMGITGKWWAFEHMGVTPDLFAFGKKSQVCGIAATARVDDVDSVFKVPSRINSTWGGNLVDMVRCQRFIEIIEEEQLLENAARVGAHALAGLEDLARRVPAISNPRGRGLMCAFDLPDSETRDRLWKKLLAARVVILRSGPKGIRFRPTLDIRKEETDLAIERIERCAKEL